MTADIVPITSSLLQLEMILFKEAWRYESPAGIGSDEGYKFCVYSATQGIAVYVRTRHQIKKADPHGSWHPRNPQDRYYNEEKQDIWERRTLLAYPKIKDQLRHLQTLREPAIVQPSVPYSRSPALKQEKIFQKPETKQIMMTPPDISLLLKPILKREDGKNLFRMLYSYG